MDEHVIFETALLTLVLLAMCCDLRRREIPDALPLALLACGFAAAAVGHGGFTWTSAWFGLAVGTIGGLGLFLFGKLGGGDGKLIAALGACLGPLSIVWVMFWMALAGGGLAVIAALRGRRDFAYAPAIALGLVVHWVVRFEEFIDVPTTN